MAANNNLCSMDSLSLYAHLLQGSVQLRVHKTFLEFQPLEFAEEDECLWSGARRRSGSSPPNFSAVEDAHAEARLRTLPKTTITKPRWADDEETFPGDYSPVAGERPNMRKTKSKKNNTSTSTNTNAKTSLPKPLALEDGSAQEPEEASVQVQQPVPSPPAHAKPTQGAGYKRRDLAALYGGGADAEGTQGGAAAAVVTSLMVRHIPCRCDEAEILSEIGEAGFAEAYDFFYMPREKRQDGRNNLGYGFINFKTPEAAGRFRERFQGHRFGGKSCRSQKECAISVAAVQGLKNNWAHFRRTAVFRSDRRPTFFTPGGTGELGNSEAVSTKK